MKNKLKNHCIIFRSLVFYLIIFLQSCTSHIERRKNAEQEHCDVDKTLSAKPYFSGDEDNIFSSGEFKQFREFRSSVQKDFKLITSTAFDHITEHAFADLLKEGAMFTAASSLGTVGLTVYGASKLVDFALSLPALKNQIENIIENYGDIPHETKIETGTKLACDFIIGALLKSGKNVSSNDTLRMCAKEGVEKVGNGMRSIIKSKNLPVSGKIRFIPRPGDIQKGEILFKDGGYVDKFGNVWKKGPSRTPNQPFEWDVQLSSTGKAQLEQLSKSGNHININLDGNVSH